MYAHTFFSTVTRGWILHSKLWCGVHRLPCILIWGSHVADTILFGDLPCRCHGDVGAKPFLRRVHRRSLVKLAQATLISRFDFSIGERYMLLSAEMYSLFSSSFSSIKSGGIRVILDAASSLYGGTARSSIEIE